MICKKCGCDYEGEICPLCHNKRSTEKKSYYGLIGMILSILGWTMKIVNYIIGFFLPIVPNIPEFPFAIAGLIVSIVGKDKNKSDKMATAGIILSSIKIAIRCISSIIICLVIMLLDALLMLALLILSIV